MVVELDCDECDVTSAVVAYLRPAVERGGQLFALFDDDQAAEKGFLLLS